MKFGKLFILLALVSLTFCLTSCITTKSPAVELFETFKEHIKDKEIDLAYDMLSPESRPTKEDFKTGIAKEWKDWFGEKGQLHTVANIQGNSNHLKGDLVIVGDESRTQQGAWEVFRKDEKSEWKVNWKLGSGIEAAFDDTNDKTTEDE